MAVSGNVVLGGGRGKLSLKCCRWNVVGALRFFVVLCLLVGCDNDETIRVSGVSLNKKKLRLEVGSVETLEATVMPADATVQELLWTSNNTEVATVDVKGLVVTFKPGSAVISATTWDGSKTDACNLTVAKLSIADFSPLEAPHGTLLRIRGEDFSLVPSENNVTLNGIAVEVVRAAPNEIEVRVPPMPRCAGPMRECVGWLKVSVADGRAVVADKKFVYLPTAVVSTLASGTQGFVQNPGSVAEFVNPQGIARDKEGNLYVTESHRIRKISPTGDVSLIAGSTTTGTADGTGAAALFSFPRGIVADAEGKNLYVVESHRIRKVSLPGGVVSVLFGGTSSGTGATQLSSPQGIAMDAEDTLYVTESHRIRNISLTGDTRVLIGGTSTGTDNGSNARFDSPQGIVLDGKGNLYVTESHRVRKISAEPAASVFAGDRYAGFSNATGGSANFRFPHGIAMDMAGNLYVADRENHRIRWVLTDGKVLSLVGGNEAGHLDGMGAAAQLKGPTGITIDAKTGTLYVVDNGNNRIRKIEFE